MNGIFFFFFFSAKHGSKPFTDLDEHKGIGVFLQTVYDRLDLPNLSPFTCFGVNFSFYFFTKFLKFEPLPERTGEKVKQYLAELGINSR